MPRGSNPRSHGNNPAIGKKKQVTMPDSYWEFAKIVGAGNQNQGVREAMRAVQIMSNSSLEKAASIIGCDATAESIQSALKQQCPGIDGVATHKNSADLIQEILLGECKLERLTANDESFLIRVVQVVSVRIKNPLNPAQELFELRQEYASGRIVERGFPGVSEKIQGAEDPHNAAVRAVREELGISVVDINLLKECDRAFNPRSAYQGIDSYTDLWGFEATISPEDFRAEYREVQASKTTVFGWQ